MSLKNLVEDSAWLFDFSFPVYRLDSDADPRKPNQWSLDDSHRLPELHALSQPDRMHASKLAWSESGIFFEMEYPKAASKFGPRDTGETLVHFLVDTRGSTGIHRANTYCHQFQFRSDIPPGATASNVRMESRLVPITRAKSSPRPIDDKDLWGWYTATDQRVYLKVFLAGDALTGFNPTDFSELGIYFYALDSQYRRHSIARLSHTIPLDDPSLWCRANLVAPD